MIVLDYLFARRLIEDILEVASGSLASFESISSLSFFLNQFRGDPQAYQITRKEVVHQDFLGSQIGTFKMEETFTD